MDWVRFSRSVYGQEAVQGAAWDPLWLFVGAALAFIVLHALWRATRRRSKAGAGQ